MTIESEEVLTTVAGVAGVILLVVLKSMSSKLIAKLREITSALDEVNDAVNHRHTRGPNSPKLYDLALQNQIVIEEVRDDVRGLLEWKDSYADDPVWATGELAERWRNHHDQREQLQDDRLTQLEIRKPQDP